MSTEKKPLNPEISKVIAYLMQNHKPKAYTQGELARITGVAQATICMNLKNERGWSIDILEKLAPGFGLPVWEIIGAAEKQDGALFRKIRLAEVRQERHSHANAIIMLRAEEDKLVEEMERRGELEK